MSPPQLDHIIILVPYATLSAIPPSISSALTIAPGGRHADNKTENRLIVLKDGVYLELIAFINDDPELKKGHWWGELPNGIIDFALTSKDVKDVGAVRERLGKQEGGVGASYGEPRAGGRKRDDGEEVKWFVTFPEGLDEGDSVRRGSVPFWCHDVTERELRVPAHEARLIEHPSRAVGVRDVVLGVPRRMLRQFRATYAAVLDVEGIENADGNWGFGAGTPFGKEGEGRIVFEGFDEEEARVLRLVLVVEAKMENRETIKETLGGGNSINIAFAAPR